MISVKIELKLMKLGSLIIEIIVFFSNSVNGKKEMIFKIEELESVLISKIFSFKSKGMSKETKIH